FFNRTREVSLEEKERTIKEILDILFTGESILYKEMGNQILLFIDKKENIPDNISKDSNKVSVKVINDTVFRYINTTKVKVYDTVRYVFFDTIRPKVEKPGPDITVEFGISPLYNFYKLTPQISEYEYFSELVNKAESPKLSFQFYSKISKSFNQLKLSSGINYCIEREKADYNINEVYASTVTETMQNWITQLDTSYREVYNSGMGGRPDSIVWTYIYENIPVDSIITYVKTDSIELLSNNPNQYHYLHFPITIGWEKVISDKVMFSINTGPSINLLISKKGQILNPNNENQLTDFDEIPFIKINTSWLINAGVYYKFKPQFAASIQLSYYQQLQSSFSSNFPFKKLSRSVLFSVGCAYYL
ncbi:hypothetical protein ACFLTE_07185, partial [Bacteroidota bacterium]